jgi:hypothetical protein
MSYGLTLHHQCGHAECAFQFGTFRRGRSAGPEVVGQEIRRGHIFRLRMVSKPNVYERFDLSRSKTEVIGSMTKIRLVLLSLLAVLAVSAIASASASAVMPAFTTAAGGLITGLLKITSTHTENAILTSKIAGVPIEIVCAEEHGSGWIENSAATGMGLSFALVHYLSCTMPKPAAGNCLVKNMLVHVTAHDLLILNGTGFRDEFAAEPGPNFTEITVESCSNSALDGTFPVKGTALAEVNNANLTLEFTETSGSTLKLGLIAATYTDTVKVEMENGGGIMVESGS